MNYHTIKYFIPITMAVLSSHLCNAQMWEVNLGDSLDVVLYAHTTAKNGSLLCGFTGNSNEYQTDVASYDAYVVKVDSAGNKIWGKTFERPECQVLLDIKPTSDGGFISVGYQQDSNGHFPFVLKADSNGNLEADTIYHSISGSSYHVLPSVTGGYFITVAGSTMSGNHHVMKLDDVLKITWDHPEYYLYPYPSFTYSGIFELADSSVLVSGTFNWFQFGGGEGYVFIDEFESDGTFVQRHKYLSDFDSDVRGGPLLTLENGHFLVGGVKDDKMHLIEFNGQMGFLADHIYSGDPLYYAGFMGTSGNNIVYQIAIKDLAYNSFAFKIEEFNMAGTLIHSYQIKSGGDYNGTSAIKLADSCYLTFGYGAPSMAYEYDGFAWGICGENTAINEIGSESTLNLTPNPVGLNQALHLENLPEGSWEISAYTISGRLIFSKELQINYSISVADHFTPGIFIVKLRNEKDNHTERAFKLVVAQNIQ